MIKKKKKSVHIILLGRKPHWCTPGMCPFPGNAVAFEQSATAFPSFPFHDAFSFRLYKIFSIFFSHKVAIRNYYSFLVTFSPTFTFSCQVSHAVLYMYTNLLGKIAAGLGNTAESAAGQLKIYFGKKISSVCRKAFSCLCPQGLMLVLSFSLGCCFIIIMRPSGFYHVGFLSACKINSMSSCWELQKAKKTFNIVLLKSNLISPIRIICMCYVKPN